MVVPYISLTSLLYWRSIYFSSCTLFMLMFLCTVQFGYACTFLLCSRFSTMLVLHFIVIIDCTSLQIQHMYFSTKLVVGTSERTRPTRFLSLHHHVIVLDRNQMSSKRIKTNYFPFTKGLVFVPFRNYLDIL